MEWFKNYTRSLVIQNKILTLSMVDKVIEESSLIKFYKLIAASMIETANRLDNLIIIFIIIFASLMISHSP